MCKKVQTPKMMREFSEKFNNEYQLALENKHQSEHYTEDLTSIMVNYSRDGRRREHQGSRVLQ